MMRLRDVAEWMETQISDVNSWRIGVYDNSIEKTICIRNLASKRDKGVVGGGKKTTSIKGISIVVHWNKSPDETEKIAQNVYGLFLYRPNINGYQTILCNMRNDEPVSLGIDDNGIYEYVIETWVTYNCDRKE